MHLAPGKLLMICIAIAMLPVGGVPYIALNANVTLVLYT